MTQAISYRPTGSPLAPYLRDIDRSPLLTAEQERALARRVAEGDPAARDRLVRSNLRLVVCIAKSYAARVQSGGLGMDDLIAEGNMGLLRAVEGFDPEMQTRFSTYASYWIKQSIKRAVINTGKTVRLPSYMVELLNKWRRASAELRDELGRDPEPQEVGDRLGLSARKLRIIQKAIRVYNSAPQEGVAGDTTPLGELAADAGPGPDARLSGEEEMRQALQFLDRLDKRDATVLRLRFGLGGEQPLTLKEVGDRLGLTRERARQIERDALRQLREMLDAA